MFGYYGKIPAQGDFIRRRADVGFVKAWDAWLQLGISTSRENLGDGWQEAYENAPIWRFCFGAGVCGPEPMIGVMMPSQDRVGRCFPLTIFARLKQAVGPEALEAEPLMTSLEDNALSALANGVGKQQLDMALEAMQLPELPLTGATGGSHWLSTFFGGASRKDRNDFDGLPPVSGFAALLVPNGEPANV